MKTKDWFARFFAIAVLAGSIAPMLAYATLTQVPITQVTPPSTSGPLTSASQTIQLIDTVSGWVATIFWIAAAIYVFYAAFLYLTAAGEEDRITRASRQLLYAVIAIAVGLMVYGLPLLIKTLLEGS